MHSCKDCGAEFEGERALNIHKGQMKNGHGWRTKQNLQELYVEKQMSTYEIAELVGVSDVAIGNALEDLGIPKRSTGESLRGKRTKKAHFKSAFDKGNDYHHWLASDGAVDADRLYVHRLLAVAKYGFDEVCGKHVHHKNEIKWDNRMENITVMDSSEHSRKHALENGLGSKIRPHEIGNQHTVD